MSALLPQACAGNHRTLLSYAVLLANRQSIQLDRIARPSKECLIVFFLHELPIVVGESLTAIPCDR
jgi:hypothetical protein